MEGQCLWKQILSQSWSGGTLCISIKLYTNMYVVISRCLSDGGHFFFHKPHAAHKLLKHGSRVCGVVDNVDCQVIWLQGVLKVSHLRWCVSCGYFPYEDFAVNFQEASQKCEENWFFCLFVCFCSRDGRLGLSEARKGFCC